MAVIRSHVSASCHPILRRCTPSPWPHWTLAAAYRAGVMLGPQLLSRPRTLDVSSCHHLLFRTAWRPQSATSFGRRPFVAAALPQLFRAYSTQNEVTQKPRLPPRPSILSRFLPQSWAESGSASSFGKIASLAKPEKKPLLMAVGLLFVSSSVSLSIPFTIGKLIDFFSSTNPVRIHFFCFVFGSTT